MNKKEIFLKDIYSIPSLIKDFFADEEYASHRFSLENVQKQVEFKEKSYSKEQRKILCEVLEKQLGNLQLSDKQKENLQILSQENAFTIVTGHQLNLFTGPAFFVYKILQTIKTTDFLNQNIQGKKFVPIFWMATEDHDFEEINHFKTQSHIYSIDGKSGGAVGRIKVEKNNFIEEFEKEFKYNDFGKELIDWMKEAYAEGKTLAEATKTLVNKLFADRGLLMIDGDDRGLKEQMKGIFVDELKNNSLKKETHQSVENLTKKYGKVQVNPREINLFYLSETRDRIEFDGEKYNVLDRDISFIEEEILAELENYPEKFSPNAVMRPVYQEKILPNIAYIGGNAEVMYWLELKEYFRHVEVPFPILIPRNSMLFLTEKTANKIQKMGLGIEEFFMDYAEIIKEKLLFESELLELLTEKEEELKKSFGLLKEKSALTDKTFRNLVEAEETRQLKSYNRMKKRLLRAEKIKQYEKYMQLRQLYLDVHPNAVWQERVLNFSVFYAQKGRGWIEECYQKMDVENSVLIISYI